jgi:hypothetical protein
MPGKHRFRERRERLTVAVGLIDDGVRRSVRSMANRLLGDTAYNAAYQKPVDLRMRFLGRLGSRGSSRLSSSFVKTALTTTDVYFKIDVCLYRERCD